MLIDKLSSAIEQPKDSHPKDSFSPRDQTKNAHNERLAGTEKRSNPPLKVPEILGLESPSEFYANLEQERS